MTQDLHYLTLEEIRQQLDVPIDQLRAFADRDVVRDYCGAIPNPRTRGVCWPPTAVPILKHLLDMRQAGKLEPKNVIGYLSDLEVTTIGQSERSTGTALIGQSGRTAELMIGQSELLTDAVERVAEGGLSLLEKIATAQEGLLAHARAQFQDDPNDCVFDAQRAAEFLCCSVRMLRACVPASFRLGATPAGDRWYRRELLKLKGGTK